MGTRRGMGLVCLLMAAGCSSAPTATSIAASPTSSPSTAPPAAETGDPVAVRVIPAEGRPPTAVDPASDCMARAGFGDPADSEYLLPFPAGARYAVNQSYCFARGGHANQLAYDFVLPIGAVVTAARAGTVLDQRDDSPDNGLGNGEHNFLMIRHEDGTVAFYAHLRQDGLLVSVGDEVTAGQPIAHAGNSGQTSGPHLHFGVYRSWPPREGYDAPIVFRNADGPLDMLGGLQDGGRYAALPPDAPLPTRPERPPRDYSDAFIGAADLAGAMLWGYDFSGADLSGADLSKAILTAADLAGATLIGADFSYADLEGAYLEGADLRNAALVGADLGRADLRGADLRGADISSAYLAVTDLRGADLTGATLEGARFIGAEWDETTRWPEGYEPPPAP